LTAGGTGVSLQRNVADNSFKWYQNGAEAIHFKMASKEVKMTHLLSIKGNHTTLLDFSLQDSMEIHSATHAEATIQSASSTAALLLEGGPKQAIMWQQGKSLSASHHFSHDVSLTHDPSSSKLNLVSAGADHVSTTDLTVLAMSTSDGALSVQANVLAGNATESSTRLNLDGASATVSVEGQSSEVKLSGGSSSFLRLSHEDDSSLFQFSGSDDLKLHDSKSDLLTFTAGGEATFKGHLNVTNVTAYGNVLVEQSGPATCRVASKDSAQLLLDSGSMTQLRVESNQSSALILTKAVNSWIQLAQSSKDEFIVSRRGVTMLKMDGTGMTWAANASVTAQSAVGVTVQAPDQAIVEVTANNVNGLSGLSSSAAVRVVSPDLRESKVQLITGDNPGTALSVQTASSDKVQLSLKQNGIEFGSMYSDSRLILKALHVQGYTTVGKDAIVANEGTVDGALSHTCAYGAQNGAVFGAASRLTSNGHCYFVSTIKTTIAAATLSCEKLGSTLVTILSEAENAHVKTLLQPDQSAFIGLSDVGFFNTFRWVTGEKSVSETGSAYDMLQSEPGSGYFGRGQADNAHKKHCATISSSGKWLLESCDAQSHFICERSF
jgi:hypothetical protein